MAEHADGATTVLHLITRFLDGGAERTTQNTIEALQDAPEEYDLRLGTGAEHDPERLAELESLGTDTVVFRSIRHYNPITAAVAVGAVARYLQRESVDILHTHSTEAGIIGRLAGALAGTPVVIHEIHGDPIAADRNELLNTFLLAAERSTAPLTTRLVVKSERIRDTFLERGIGRPEQYELIYHGVDLDSIGTAAGRTGSRVSLDSDHIPGQAPVRAIFVGRLAEGKGLFDLLDAVEPLADVSLDIVGDGPLAEDLAAAVSKRGLDDRVTLHGYRDDVPELMAEAEFLILPSYREGTPRVITEARAAKLPVIATDIAGIPEMVADGENGYLVQPGDVATLRDRIRTLADDPALRNRMGEAAHSGLEKFSRETAAEAYRSLYRELSTSL